MAADPQAGAVPPVLADHLYRRPPGYFTEADLDALPESHQYEVVDGMLVVNPPPGLAHQRLVGHLLVQLHGTRPPGLEALHEIGYRQSTDRLLIPDLVVARNEDFDPRGLVGTPLLVVEVRSPSTGAKDRSWKRDLYQEAGVPSYWLADPGEPALTVLELDESGQYVETARVAGGDELRLERPYPVTLRLT